MRRASLSAQESGPLSAHTHSSPCSATHGCAATQERGLAHAVAWAAGSPICGMFLQRPELSNRHLQVAASNLSFRDVTMSH